MGKYRFEIQNCITYEVIAENKEDARDMLVNNPDWYEEELAGPSCWISDGEEIIKQVDKEKWKV